MLEDFYKGKKILVTGGSGSIGSEIVKKLLEYDVDNRELVEKYKNEAAEFICGKYNWDDVVERTLELYK